MQANALFHAAKGRLKDRTELAAEANLLRKRFLSDVTTLKERGVLPSANLIDLKGPSGHLNVACDVMSLANFLRSNWDAISGRYPVTLEELDRAEVISDDLTQAIGVRERVPEALILAGNRRTRAYTLFIRAYTEVRNAVIYVRREKQDYDRFAPSLYHGRKSTKRLAEPLIASDTKEELKDQSNNDPFLH
jgi:hypothetical protein